ncbi:Aminopeptidase N [Hahella chejuensis KCTC 2396]|uniref:Aminopeptidase N n=1 Tax=Hahella chejuensis (strain KCTC 2396) TaxID=349521 RepID=Q2SDI6_HAHCH|nr:aminopeptidase N [Hahella chejuensis]ABC31288.1 Aminopeptidase N [Hahella chejuensis KCTC 2396]
MKESQPRTIYLKDYRKPDFLIDATDLNFQLYEDGARVTSQLHIRRNPDADAFRDVLELDGVELQLERLLLDGRTLNPDEYQLDDETLRLERLPKQFVLTVVTWIKPQENTCLEGLYRSSSMFCTQCEAEGFRRITYYLDRPDVMSSFTTTIEAEKSRYPVLLSNGNPVASGESGDRHWVKWEDPFKKPCYLFALVAGDLEWVEDSFTTMSGREVQLRIYVEPQDLNKCSHAMDSLKRSMTWDEEVYGREYDLDIFNIVAVSDFNMGAMENKGLNIFNSSCVLANPETSTDSAFQRIEAIVAHEYFHNWSGNRVTCRDWFQLSLKEGFTVFRDAEFSADMHSRAVKRIEDVALLRTMQFAEDAGPMSHPVRPDSYMEISNFYTLTVYEKGSEVVRMLHTLLEPEKFREGSDLYFSRFDGQAVTTDDFVACMEEVSGQDFTQFKRWYSQSGTPVLTVTDHYDAETSEYRLDVKQSCPPTPGQQEKQPFQIPLAVGLLDGSGKDMPLTLKAGQGDASGADGDLTRNILVRESEQSFVFTGVTEKPTPSLLRSFSAPVRLNYPYDRNQLTFLMSFDSDGFNRWDAGQKLAVSVFNELINAELKGEQVDIDERYIDAMRQVLLDDKGDHAMLAKMVQVPGVSLLAEQAEVVHVDAILNARQRVHERIGASLSELLLSKYRQLHAQSGNALDSVSMGLRAYKNACLMLLAQGGAQESVALAKLQMQQAQTMTDEFGALAALVNGPDIEAAQSALADFLCKWKKDQLVMEQWFSVQAASERHGALDSIQALTAHELFSERNPNKVRSVIGTFGGQNWRHFHAADGSGYRFLREWIIKMDGLNPQIASRLLTPLTRWRKLEPQRSALMQKELQEIMAHPGLSRDAYEVVSKSLK